MTHQLSQKERSLLQDQLSHEEICIQKYNSYASRAKDPELKNMFSQFGSDEEKHYNTINGYLQNQGQNPAKVQGQGFRSETRNYGEELDASASRGADEDEKSMLSDMLMTEKFVSGAYDTAVFESTNPSLRRDLQDIQKDEQKHGEGIFQYMQKHGMYNVQY